MKNIYVCSAGADCIYQRPCSSLGAMDEPPQTKDSVVGGKYFALGILVSPVCMGALGSSRHAGSRRLHTWQWLAIALCANVYLGPSYSS